MTTPKEALRIARGYIVDDIKRKPSEYDPAGDLKKIDEALASLEGDAVERVAETAQTFWQGSSGRPWTECCEKLPAQANWFRRLARAILATGLVAGEAAIRADEREKCAKVADEFVTGEVTFDDFCDGMSAGAKTVAAAIRSGGGAR